MLMMTSLRGLYGLTTSCSLSTCAGYAALVCVKDFSRRLRYRLHGKETCLVRSIPDEDLVGTMLEAHVGCLHELHIQLGGFADL